VRLLLSYGANPQKADKFGKTSLMYACAAVAAVGPDRRGGRRGSSVQSSSTEEMGIVKEAIKGIDEGEGETKAETATAGAAGAAGTEGAADDLLDGEDMESNEGSDLWPTIRRALRIIEGLLGAGSDRLEQVNGFI
jgi:hypothetical protein